jgi:hypothetical protein
MMNNILKDLLDDSDIVFKDNVLIYPKRKQRYDVHMEEILKRLAENDLLISPEKCKWSSEPVEILGYVITPDGMELSEDIIDGIKKWQEQRH